MHRRLAISDYMPIDRVMCLCELCNLGKFLQSLLLEFPGNRKFLVFPCMKRLKCNNEEKFYLLRESEHVAKVVLSNFSTYDLEFIICNMRWLRTSILIHDGTMHCITHGTEYIAKPLHEVIFEQRFIVAGLIPYQPKCIHHHEAPTLRKKTVYYHFHGQKYDSFIVYRGHVVAELTFIHNTRELVISIQDRIGFCKILDSLRRELRCNWKRRKKKHHNLYGALLREIKYPPTRILVFSHFN